MIKPASSYLGEDAAVKISSGLLALTFVAMGAASQLWQLLVCLMPLAAGSIMITTLNTARLSKVRPTAQSHYCAGLREGGGQGLVGGWGRPVLCVVRACVCIFLCFSFQCLLKWPPSKPPHAPCLLLPLLLSPPLAPPQSVPNNVAGTVMALDMSLGSGLRTVSPLIGTALVQRHGFQGVCVTAAAVLLTSFSAANHLRAPKPKAAAGHGSGGEDAAGVQAQGSTAESPEGKKTD